MSSLLKMRGVKAGVLTSGMFKRNFAMSAIQPGIYGKDLLSAVLSLPPKERDNHFDTVVVGYTDLYGRTLGKRYDIDYFLSGVDTSTMKLKPSKACSYTLTFDMPQNPLTGFEFANWEKGFGDFSLQPDISTLRQAAWLDKTLFVLCDVVNPVTGELVPIAPRSILKNAIRKLEAVAKQSFTVNAATELEYFLYNNTYEECAAMDYRINPSNSFGAVSFTGMAGVVQPAGYFAEDYHIMQSTRNEPFTQHCRRMLKRSGLNVETSKGETGVGQHELNLKYDECLAMADAHVVFKQCLKESAMLMGKSVSFMAKPVHHEAGSGCHVHLSLWDKGKTQNLFYKGANEDASSYPVDFKDGAALGHSSELFRHFLGGWMDGLPEMFVFYCPTVNSYKRHVAGSWAPTGAAFGIDNRTTAFRVVTDDGPPVVPKSRKGGLRIESRIAGADVNPYLILAASVLSGANGVAKKLEPGPVLRGDAYAIVQKLEKRQFLPKSLKEAAERFGESDTVKNLFGEDVQKHYTRFYQYEQQAFDKYVTDWERKRYFEHI